MSGNDRDHSRSGRQSLPRRTTEAITAAWLLALLGLLGGTIVLVIGTQTHARS